MNLFPRRALRNNSSHFTRSLTFLFVLAGLLFPATEWAQTPPEGPPQFQLQPRSRQSLVEPDPAPPTHRIHGVKYKFNAGRIDNQGNSAGLLSNNTAPTCSSPRLSYFNGPVVSNVQSVVIFWGSEVNSQLTAPTTGIAQFLSDVGTSPFFGVVDEYSSYGNSITGGTDQWIGSGSPTVPSYTITPTKCPGTANCTLQDSDIQDQLNYQIGVGNLPAPTTDLQGNDNTIYMFYFPPKVSVNLDGSLSCNAFCAYHNTGTYTGTGSALVYGVLMDEFTTACAEGCGGNDTDMENMTSTSSHELAEAITDADIGLDTGEDYAYPAGWGDNSNNCGEIADICDSGGAGDTFTFSGRTWTVQELWSNKQGKCVSTSTISLPYSFSSPGTVTSGTPFNFSVTAQNPTGGTFTSYTGTVHFTSSDPSASLPADYTYVVSDAGAHTFQATLVTGTSQTITATDSAHPTLTLGTSFSITSPAATAPVLTSPTPGGTLTGPSATFTWTSVSGSQGYWLFLGTTGVGSKNLYDSNEQAATSATFSNLPTDGVTIYARVYARVNGTLYSNDYTYTAAVQPPVLTSPAPGSTLPSTSATFTWTASGGQGYWLFVGTTGVGSKNIIDTGQQSATSATVSGLPSNGTKLYVRVYSRVNGTLYFNDYTYTSYMEPPVMTSPSPGTTLGGTSATFTWTAASSGNQGYWLFLGTTGVGSKNLYDSGQQTATFASFSGLPTNGVTIYARVYTRYNGVLVYNDYTYTAQ